MNASELFAVLVAQRGRVAASLYSSQPAYNLLIETGVIEETSIVPSIACNECDQAHDAAIIYEGAQYGYYCPDFGFVSKPRSELIDIQCNLGAFTKLVAEHLGCKRRRSTPLHSDTWRIGAIDTPSGNVALYLTPTMQDAQDTNDFGSAIAGEVKSPFGIVLTSKGTLSFAPYVTVHLQDVLSFEHEKLTVIADFTTIAGVPEIRTGGRPNDFKIPLGRLIAIRESEGRALTGRNEEADALLAEFKTKFPHEKSPSLPTVRKYVSAARHGS